TDILPAAERAGAFGRVGAAFGMGLVLGPVLGGTLGSIGLRLPFWTASAIAAANAGWAAFALAESLPKARRATFRFASANPLGALAFL
ncbi:MFS transporter, partial [Enterococcus faecium]|uniref:MFS transporter n=1 Tax=Enterococcus faecium TaxID=1352 RepID=UPI003F42236F